jgi:DNA-binding IclR family transcriptional regulator
MTDPRATAQTLDRGLAILELLAAAPQGATIAELAQACGLHRSIVTRLVATLAGRHFAYRTADGRVRFGSRLVLLASRQLPRLTFAARPHLESLAAACGATAHLSLAEGDECVAVLVVEPPDSLLHVTFRLGSRHPLDRAAGGYAILAARPRRTGEPAGAVTARRRGYAQSSHELQRGAHGIATALVGLSGPDGLDLEAAVGVVALARLDPIPTAQHVRAAARAIEAAVTGD